MPVSEFLMDSSRPIPFLQSRPAVSEEMIRDLVHAFYGRVRRDEKLGPVFSHALHGRWEEHLATMVDFWSSVALSTGRYRGKPHMAHRGLGLSAPQFARWLALFETAAREVCGDAGAFFIDRAHRIADSLMIGLDIGPNAIVLPPVDMRARL